MRKTVAILGIPIDDLDTGQVLVRLGEFIESRRFHQIATANTDFLVRSVRDSELRTILLTADMVVPDGMPIVAASRWLGASLRERVAGSDLVPKLAETAAKEGYRIFMLGGREEVAQSAKQRLEEQNPGLQVVGCVSPPVASVIEMDNEGILDKIEESKPDILLVAFGNPKQEKWIHMHRDRLNVPVCIGVGATFDFIAGAFVRAPVWVQRFGMEWFHRLCQDPRRLSKRYAQDIWHFGRLIAVQLWLMRGRKSEESRLSEVQLDGNTVISVTGRLDSRLLAELQFVADRALSLPSHIILDLQAVTGIDSVVMGTLLNLPKRAAFAGREIRIVGQSRGIRRALRSAGIDDVICSYNNVAGALAGNVSEHLDSMLDVTDSSAVLTFRGHATIGHIELLQSELKRIPEHALSVLLDLRAVDRIDSSALLALYRFAKDRGDLGGEASLIPSPAVFAAVTGENLSRPFKIVDVRADTVFDGAPTPEVRTSP